MTSSTADVLVSSDDSYITMGGGVSAALLRAGGESILRDAAKKVPVAPGEVVVTTAGSLRAKYIFHAITLGDTDLGASEIVSRATKRCIELLGTLGLRSIAFPAIGTGVAGFSHSEVAAQMASVLVNSLSTCETPVDATIFLFDRFRQMQPIDYFDFFEQFAVYTQQMSLVPEALPPTAGQQRDETSPAIAEPTIPEDQLRRRQSLVDLGDLDSERQALEAKLAELASSLTKHEVDQIERRLLEVHRQRVELLGTVTAKPAPSPVEVFVSYARADETLRVELGKHLSILHRQGLIATWHDRMISAGSEWSGVIHEKLNTCRIVLLLLSSDFVDSQYCYEVEMKRAMERHERRQALVIPIVLRPVVLKGTPFAKLQALPKDARPATEWASLDSAFVSVTEGLRDALESLAALDEHGAVSDRP